MTTWKGRLTLIRCLAISDLHGNLPALEAVLAAAGQVDLVISTGDYVGFGLQPNQVVSKIRGLPNLAPVQGNWSIIAQRPIPDDTDTPSKKVMKMSLAMLTQETREFLKYLPARGYLNIEGVSVAFLHQTVLDPFEGDLTPNMDPALLKCNAEASHAQLVIHGDTHVQGRFQADGVTFVNPGSVGWPSDGDWRPAYAIIELDRGTFQVDLLRVEYDVEAVYREIEKVGIPNAKNILKGVSWRAS